MGKLKALLYLLPVGALLVTITALVQENYLRLAIAAMLMFAYLDLKRKFDKLNDEGADTDSDNPLK